MGGVKCVAAGAEAQALGARAGAKANWLGAGADTEAVVGKVRAGLDTGCNYIDHNASVEAKGPNASAGAQADLANGNLGVSFGASAGEARAGPLAVRAGVQFGAGIRGGVPYVDAGPVSCCVQ